MSVTFQGSLCLWLEGHMDMTAHWGTGEFVFKNVYFLQIAALLPSSQMLHPFLCPEERFPPKRDRDSEVGAPPPPSACP